MDKIKIVKIALFAEGIILVSFCLAHCLFPEESHLLMNQQSFDINNPWIWAAIQEMGITFFVFGISAFIAAVNPLKYRHLVFIVVLFSILSDFVRSTAILFKGNSPRLWVVVIVSVTLWLLIVVFYPYKKLRDINSR